MAYCLPLSFAYHESSQSWRELLGQLKRLGLSGSPKLVAGHADPSLSWWHWPFAFKRTFCTPVAHETTMLVMGPRPFRALEI
jgi:hypothetical protein